MADPIDTAHVAVATGSAIAGGGGVGMLVRFFIGRDAERKATEQTVALAVLTQKVEALIVMVARTDAMREELAVLKASNKRLHQRLDRLEGDLENQRQQRERSHE